MAKRLAKEVAVFLDAYDPGLHTTRVMIGIVSEGLDLTVFGEAGERTTAGIRKDTLEWAGIFDDAATGGTRSMDAAAKNLIGSGARQASVLFGTGTGQTFYGGTGWHLLSAKEPARIGEIVMMETIFQGDGTWERGVTLSSGARGLVLTTGGQTGPTVDGAAATTAGGALYIHAMQFTGSGTGTTMLIAMDDSADSTTWSEKFATSFAGTTGTALRFALTGTIRRYTRQASGTYSGGTFFVGLVRS